MPNQYTNATAAAPTPPAGDSVQPQPDPDLYGVLRALGHNDDATVAVCEREPVEGAKFASETYTVGSLREAEVPEDLDVWFGPNPVRSGLGEGRKGRIADVVRVQAIFVDLDLKNTAIKKTVGFETLEECHAVVDRLSASLGVQPTVLIYSGHGLQPVWRVKDAPELADATATDKWSKIYARWAVFVRQAVAEVNPAAKSDSIFHLDRILRCPGSVNVKDPVAPVPVRTEVFPDAGDVSLDVLLAVLPEVENYTPRIPSEGTTADRDLSLLVNLRGGEMTPKVLEAVNKALTAIAEGSDRHGAVTSVQMSLINLGLNGHTGVRKALDLLRTAFAAVGQSRNDPGEFDRALKDAVMKNAVRLRGIDFNTHGAFEPGGVWHKDTPLRGVNREQALEEKWIDKSGNLLVSNLFVDADNRGNAASSYQSEIAELFHEHRYGVLRYVGDGHWARFTGKRWEIAREDVTAFGELQSFRKSVFLRSQTEDDIKVAPIPSSAAMLGGLASSSRNMFFFNQGGFDCNPYELNTPAGIVDFKDGKLRRHDPQRLHSRIAKVAPDFKADPPGRFLAFLDQVTLGDAEMADYLLALLGACLLGEPGGQYLHILLGEGGNGKGVLLNIMEGLLGIGGKEGAGYYLELEGIYLTLQKTPKHEAETADLHGSRMVVLSEFHSGSKFNATRLKNSTGGNVVSASFKGQDPFTFRMSATFIANSNVIPDTSEVNNSMRRRLCQIPFDYTHAGPQNDNFYKDLVEEEGGAIMALLCRKAKEQVASGGMPDETPRMKSAISGYFDEQDPISRFLEECAEVRDGGAELNQDLKGAFAAWCAREDIAERDRPKGEALITHLKTKGHKTDYTQRNQDTGGQDGRRRTKGLVLNDFGRSLVHKVLTLKTYK
ncbi:phage/plasmid primase, P4 family [Rhodococcus coprophilus]|uniref:DNA primase family protein n=1 Tax=Rhodococcus coprophilus TaxID=38310 RepID=UPI00342DE702